MIAMSVLLVVILFIEYVSVFCSVFISFVLILCVWALQSIRIWIPILVNIVLICLIAPAMYMRVVTNKK